MHTSSTQLDLKFGLSFEDLYRREGLVRLDAKFRIISSGSTRQKEGVRAVKKAKFSV